MGNRFSKEVEDFVSAFRTGNDIGYKMRYLRYLEKQQDLRRLELQNREQRKTGIPSYEQDLINEGEKGRFGPRSETETPTPAPAPKTQTATVQPKKQEIPDATPTTKVTEGGSSDGSTPQSKGGGGSSGGEKHSSITDRYPGSYQTAALETGTMNDASPVRGGYGVPAPQGGATPKLAHFDAGKAPSYLDAIAQKHGIDPTDFKRMAWIESKFDPNARASGSSAGGLFQFTDDTARRYGLGNKFDGVANAEAAARLWNDNKAGLTKALGRAPTAGELYLAHQQGLGGATALLTNPNGSAAAAVGAKAVTNNGGRAGMSAREFSNMWTGRFDNIGNEAGTTPRSTGNAPATPPATPSGNQAVNTRQRTAADASSMSDANNDVRRTGGITQAVPADTTPKSSGAKYSSGADLEGKTFKEAYNESIKSAQPAATTQASTTPTYLTDAQVLEAVRKGEHINYDSAGRAISTSSGEMATSGNPDAVQKAAPTEAPEFPKTAGQETPTPPSRPEELKPAVEPLQPAVQPTAEAAPQQDGWSFLDDIGRGIEDFFSDLNVPADWDVGGGDANWGSAADAGGDFGGIGGALGGIGDAIGGIFSGFNRGGMVR